MVVSTKRFSLAHSEAASPQVLVVVSTEALLVLCTHFDPSLTPKHRICEPDRVR